jgi:hypothetical protein
MIGPKVAKPTPAESRTRTLKHGDSIPTVEPRKYLNRRGYVRLRWLVGANDYVEAYEHRVVMGLPEDSVQVHHVNGVKTDNRPENLQLLTLTEHRRLHVELGTPQKHKPRQPLSEYPSCGVDQCDRAAQCVNRTLCLKHYKRLRRHGSTSDAFGAKQ